MRWRGERLCKFWPSVPGSSEHGGQFPKSLDALVPAELASLPIDPFSGRSFGYIPSHGQDIPPLRTALTPSLDKGHGPTPGSWLLYSVGPDGHDDGGITFTKDRSARHQLMDIVFEIPPLEGGGAGKEQETAKNRPALARPPSTPDPGP